MSNWNPFRRLTPDEQRAIVIKFPGEQCAVCGERFGAGARALPMKPSDFMPGVDKPFPAYPKYGGGSTLNTTYRHLDCTPR